MSDHILEMKINARISVAEYTIRILRGCKILFQGRDSELDSWIQDLQVGIETLKIDPIQENLESLAYMIRRYRKLSSGLLDELEVV